MKLKTMMNKMKPSDYVKIGTEYGSSFILAGTVEAVSAEMNDPDTRAKLYRQVCGRCKKYEKIYANARKKYEESDKTAQDLGDLRSIATTYDRIKTCVDDYTALGDHEVLDGFKAHPIIDDVPDVTVLNIEGIENGTLAKIDKDGKGVVMK